MPTKVSGTWPSWGSLRVIQNLPSMVPPGMDRQFLPQVIDRLRVGRRLQIMGDEMNIYTDTDGIHDQSARRPILSMLGRRPLIGIVRAQVEKNIPTWPGPRMWPTGALIERLPSVVQTGGGVPGPSRTMHPEISVLI